MLTRRHLIAAGSAALAAPAILPSGARAETKSVKIATILAGTTIASFLLPERLKAMGFDAETLVFPSITQRMQAVASGDAQIGYGGVSAAISLGGRGTALSILSNACDGGWALTARPEIAALADLAGRKVAAQAGTIQHLSLQWKLIKEGLAAKTEVVFMNPQDMPAALRGGDIDAMMAPEPYAAFPVVNGWGKPLWSGYDTPMGRCNLALMAAPAFVEANPATTKAVLDAHREITAQLQKDPSSAADAIVKTLNLPRPVALASLQNTFFTTETGPDFRRQVEALGQMMLEARMTAKLPDWNRLLPR
ncbi:ABC transporter substrate-binding protein [Methylobacterium terricola]|nr:ABC transporter substrate-binding protein [Methylobacterium terricola]